MSTQSTAWIRPFVCGVALALPIGASAAQGPAPIHGLTGIIALPENVDKLYSGMNEILVKTSDGLERVFHVTPGTKVHGGNPALGSLSAGTVVAVHYSVKGVMASADEIDRLGPDGLKHNEGTITKVDRVRKRITIKFADRSIQTLRLTHHAAVESNGHTHSRVIIYYSNDNGQRVAHYFKPVKQ
jgi:hypothetical protein